MGPSVQNARDRCEELGGNLPIIRSAGENQFIFDQIKNVQGISNRGVWIDAERQADGKFVWGDGTPLEGHYTNWDDGEPNDQRGNEDCVHMYGQNGGHESFWNDVPCDFFLPGGGILCQRGI